MASAEQGVKRATATAWILALGLAAAVLAAPRPARRRWRSRQRRADRRERLLPVQPAVAAGLQKSLNAETAGASRLHFPIKVALIASPADLGAIPSLFAKPQQYADFLDQEISFAGTKQLPAGRDAGRLRRAGARPLRDHRRGGAGEADRGDRATTWHRPRSSPCRSSPPPPVIRSPASPEHESERRRGQ